MDWTDALAFRKPLGREWDVPNADGANQQNAISERENRNLRFHSGLSELNAARTRKIRIKKIRVLYVPQPKKN
jgi:hypothetical protein